MDLWRGSKHIKWSKERLFIRTQTHTPQIFGVFAENPENVCVCVCVYLCVCVCVCVCVWERERGVLCLLFVCVTSTYIFGSLLFRFKASLGSFDVACEKQTAWASVVSLLPSVRCLPPGGPCTALQGACSFTSATLLVLSSWGTEGLSPPLSHSGSPVDASVISDVVYVRVRPVQCVSNTQQSSVYQSEIGPVCVSDSNPVEVSLKLVQCVSDR